MSVSEISAAKARLEFHALKHESGKKVIWRGYIMMLPVTAGVGRRNPGGGCVTLTPPPVRLPYARARVRTPNTHTLRAASVCKVANEFLSGHLGSAVTYATRLLEAGRREPV